MCAIFQDVYNHATVTYIAIYISRDTTTFLQKETKRGFKKEKREREREREHQQKQKSVLYFVLSPSSSYCTVVPPPVQQKLQRKFSTIEV
jgi:hypothetical protein